MPGDKIIIEGEKGNEMYFIQEGVVEVLVHKTKPGTVSESYIEKIFLEKGKFFGEVRGVSFLSSRLLCYHNPLEPQM